jgi:hypothetical protein
MYKRTDTNVLYVVYLKSLSIYLGRYRAVLKV